VRKKSANALPPNNAKNKYAVNKKQKLVNSSLLNNVSSVRTKPRLHTNPHLQYKLREKQQKRRDILR